MRKILGEVVHHENEKYEKFFSLWPPPTPTPCPTSLFQLLSTKRLASTNFSVITLSGTCRVEGIAAGP